MNNIRGSVAVVTGAASGIGLGIAHGLAAEGANLLVTDIDGDGLALAAAELRTHGTQVEAATLDVRDPAAFEIVGDRCVERFGALNIAVNNAGIVNGGLAWELSLDDWHKVIDINLWGVIHGVHAFVPRILASGAEGHVVNVASMAAVDAISRLAPYTVAKHGVLGLSDVLRADLASVDALVGVSVVFPGRIKTGMNPIGTVEPATVAANVIDAIKRQRPYVFTDDHSTAEVRSRLEAILSARGDVIDAS
ncbi:SDR family NAD(P)-dependent oxidoreductase [Aquihabitans sp. McL0605]|uniref:SDR family NAD(P)-dependent oxidoreductase n=1 Tax=Aquihabitans sp. McL0605 TaxID=3415671 RepID=UPI003CF1228E